MDSDRFERIQSLVGEALELPEGERAAFLESEAQGDEEMLSEARSLLEAAARAHTFFDGLSDRMGSLTPEGAADRPSEDVAAWKGRRIGPYRLVEVLGEGGMGVVWRAEQEEPIRREVALKAIKLGMETDEVVGRFRQERQALAVMDHPSIARVFDAGATEEGRPYFVMELVDGERITDFADRHRLSSAERIELFNQVCAAVQHAHQKGVVHRDLKPSNVLVTLSGRKPIPKIIDFGVAKALGPLDPNETIVRTALDLRLGTPQYMSPEQLERDGPDVDSRTDVFSLGILLYELLVGASPLGPEEVARYMASPTDPSTDPPRPSTRYSNLTDSRDEVAARRGTDPQHLRKELAGDLDWIVMRAMDRDRERRYATPIQLADDLRRYLAHEPVTARPPGRAYRARKFIRRNRTLVTASAVGFGAIVVGAVAAAAGMIEARAAQARAEVEAETARQVADFVVGLFEVNDPGAARGNSITAREILDRGADQISEELADQPEVQARMLNTIGSVYWALGLEPEAEELVREAMELRTTALGPDHPDVASSARLLATILGSHFGGIGNETRDEQLTLLTRAREVDALALGPDDPMVAEDWILIGTAYIERMTAQSPERFEEAKAAYEEGLRILERAFGPNDIRLARPYHNLGELHRNWMGQPEEARPYLQRALEIREAEYGPESAELLRTLYSLFRIEELNWSENPEPALEIYRRMAAIPDEEILDAEADIGTFVNLGNRAYFTGRFDDAEAAYSRVLRIATQLYGDDMEMVAIAQVSLANLYASYGRWEDAIAAGMEALRVWEHNDREIDVGDSHYLVGFSEAALGNLERAEEEVAIAVEVFERFSRTFDYPAALWTLARIQRERGRTAAADETYARMLAAHEESATAEGARGANWRFYALALVGCQEEWMWGDEHINCPEGGPSASPGDLELAIEYAERALDDVTTPPYHRVAAVVYHAAGRNAEALAAIRTALEEVDPESPLAPDYRRWAEILETAAG